MRLHGWCEKCRRFRLVTVLRPRWGGVQVGVCDECQDEERAKRAERRRP